MSNIPAVAKYIAEKNEISGKDSSEIIKKLSISDLRTLLKRLKTESSKCKVSVFSETSLSKDMKKKIKELFSGKQVEFLEDKKVGAGVKIKTYDMIYDLSLSGKIARIADTLE